MRQQPNRSRTYLNRVMDKLNRYPGGMGVLVAEYKVGAISIQDITDETGVAYRAVKRAFRELAVESRGRSDALRLVWSGDETRRASCSARAKRVLASAEVQAESRVARRKAHLLDPSKHLNSKVGMSKYERIVSAALTDAGFEHQFNKPFPPYWLDFWIPRLNLGIESQKMERYPSQDRDKHLRECGLRTVLYFHTYWVKKGHVGDLIKVLHDIAADRIDPAELGDYTLISRRPHGKDFIEINGSRFRWPFGPMQSKSLTAAARPMESTRAAA